MTHCLTLMNLQASQALSSIHILRAAAPLKRLGRRRIANRESARRVRQKRQEQLDELEVKVHRFCSLALWGVLGDVGREA